MTPRFLAIVGFGLLLEAWSRHRAGRWDRWKADIAMRGIRARASELPDAPPPPGPFPAPFRRER